MCECIIYSYVIITCSLPSHNNPNVVNFRSLTALALIPFRITTTPELAGTVGVGIIE